MKLFYAELRKVWGQKIFVLSLAVLAAANLFFLYIGTKSAPYNPTPGSYRAFAADIALLDQEDRQNFIHEKLDEVKGLREVQQLVSWGIDPYTRERFADVLEQYEEQFRSGDYSLYTENLEKEYMLVSAIAGEADEVCSYPQFLEEIQAKAQRLSGISIFQNASDDFSKANIRKTAAVYEGMAGAITLDYSPQKGIVTALDYQLTDLVLLAAMILTAGLLVRQERDNQLIHLIRSMPGGRLKTALAKYGVLAVTLFAFLVLLYGVNLLYCGMIFGLGSFSRSIQSVPALMRCTMQISVGEYLGLFLLVKWAGTVVVGAWVMIAMLWAHNMMTGCIFSALMPFVHWMIRTAIEPNSHWNILKYANLASLMRTNELLGNYRNLYFFEKPVSLAFVEWTSAAFYGGLFFVWFCLVFCRGKLSASSRHFAMQTSCLHRSKATTVRREECRKLFVICGAGIVLILFTAAQTVKTIQSEKIIDDFGMCYEEYMKQLEGPYTKETYDKLQEMYREFYPLIKAQAEAERGNHSSWNPDIRYDILSMKKSVFERKIQYGALPYIKEHPEAHLVYERGWEKLFGFSGNEDLQDALWASLLSSICFAGLFSYEKKGGMQRVIMATPLGRSETVKQKILAGMMGSVIITLVTWLPHLIDNGRHYGLSEWFAPAMSLHRYEHLDSWIPLAGMVFYSLLGRLTACVLMMLVMAWISDHLDSVLSAMFSGCLLFVLLPMLALSGLYPMKWISVFPLFHLAALACQPSGFTFGILCFVAAACIGWVCFVKTDWAWNDETR